MRFSFVGTVDANDLDSKVPYFREIENGLSLNLISIAAKNNRAFVETAGFKNDPIKTKDNDGNDIEIAWEDREKKEFIDNVSVYRKNVITLGDTRSEFVSTLDFVEFVVNHIDEIKGKRYQITGNVKKNLYKGKLSDKFTIQSMYEVAADDDKKKNDFVVTGDFYFTKDSIDSADFAKEKKIYLNGWTKEYVDKDHKNVFCAKQLVLDCNKIDFNQEKHVAQLVYRLKQIGCTLDDKKAIVSKLKKDKVYKIAVITKYLNGNEEAEFDESQLTPNQKEAIALGLSTLDDFRPSGKIFGDRIVTYKLSKFDLRGNYCDGCIVADDFVESNIFTPIQNESLDEAFKEDAMNIPIESDGTDMDSLFD